jgi:putative ABC transport system permease protein
MITACLYPAIALSSFSPIRTIRNNLTITGKNNLRRVLVVFQFACSTILIISIFVIVQQLHFMRNHDKGLSLDKVIAIKIPEPDWSRDSINQQRMGLLRQKITQLSGVRSVATSSIVPGQGITTIAGTSGGLFWTENPAVVSSGTIYFYHTDTSFFQTYGIRILAGSTYQASTRREANGNVLINESALKLFGFPDAQSAIGKDIANSSNPANVIKVHGVVADFQIESSKEPVRPTLYYCSPPLTWGYVSVKADINNEQQLLTQMEQVWKVIYPEAIFNYSFVEHEFNLQHKAEERLALIVTGFTLFAVFIACIGLFGLAFITAGQRTKEIGVRKVLGATIANIVTLLSKDYMKLVFVAIIIGSPVAAVIMNAWLQDFAYRIRIEWWVFVVAGIIAIAIALLTVSYQSIKAALTNPIKNLRTE